MADSDQIIVAKAKIDTSVLDHGFEGYRLSYDLLQTDDSNSHILVKYQLRTPLTSAATLKQGVSEDWVNHITTQNQLFHIKGTFYTWDSTGLLRFNTGEEPVRLLNWESCVNVSACISPNGEQIVILAKNLILFNVNDETSKTFSSFENTIVRACHNSHILLQRHSHSSKTNHLQILRINETSDSDFEMLPFYLETNSWPRSCRLDEQNLIVVGASCLILKEGSIAEPPAKRAKVMHNDESFVYSRIKYGGEKGEIIMQTRVPNSEILSSSQNPSSPLTVGVRYDVHMSLFREDNDEGVVNDAAFSALSFIADSRRSIKFFIISDDRSIALISDFEGSATIFQFPPKGTTWGKQVVVREDSSILGCLITDTQLCLLTCNSFTTYFFADSKSSTVAPD